MTQLLMLREKLIRFYQEHMRLLRFVFSFLIAFVTFFSISRMVGYDPVFKSWYAVLIISLLGSVLPWIFLPFLAAVYTVWHIHSVSMTMAVILALIFFIFYLVYLRFKEEHGYVILAVPVLFVLHIPYVIPILLGMAGSVLSIVPMSCGIVCYYLLKNITVVVSTATEDNLLLYNQTVQLLLTDRNMYLALGGFLVVLIVVYILRNQEFKYSFEMAMGIGAIVNIIFILVFSFSFDIPVSVIYLFLETALSLFLVWMIWFFRLTVNYSATEYLQFEDDEYYYYVKAIPKASISAAERTIKRYNAKDDSEEEASDEEAEETPSSRK